MPVCQHTVAQGTLKIPGDGGLTLAQGVGTGVAMSLGQDGKTTRLAGGPAHERTRGIGRSLEVCRARGAPVSFDPEPFVSIYLSI